MHVMTLTPAISICHDEFRSVALRRFSGFNQPRSMILRVGISSKPFLELLLVLVRLRWEPVQRPRFIPVKEVGHNNLSFQFFSKYVSSLQRLGFESTINVLSDTTCMNTSVEGATLPKDVVYTNESEFARLACEIGLHAVNIRTRAR